MSFYISQFVLGIMFTLVAEIVAVIMIVISQKNKIKREIEENEKR